MGKLAGLLIPKTPKVKAPVPLPVQDDAEAKRARTRLRSNLRAGTGRNSTLLSGRSGLGAFVNKNIGD